MLAFPPREREGRWNEKTEGRGEEYRDRLCALVKARNEKRRKNPLCFSPSLSFLSLLSLSLLLSRERLRSLCPRLPRRVTSLVFPLQQRQKSFGPPPPLLRSRNSGSRKRPSKEKLFRQVSRSTFFVPSLFNVHARPAAPRGRSLSGSPASIRSMGAQPYERFS